MVVCVFGPQFGIAKCDARGLMLFDVSGLIGVTQWVSGCALLCVGGVGIKAETPPEKRHHIRNVGSFTATQASISSHESQGCSAGHQQE